MTVTNIRFGAIIECSDITPGIPLTRVAMALQELAIPDTYTSPSGDLTFKINVVGLGDDPNNIPGAIR